MELPIETSHAAGPPGQQTMHGIQLHGFALASVLIAIMCTLLLAALDQTIVGTALPHIVAELNGADRYTWVVTSYLLTSTTVIPIMGKLSDQFGRKWFIVFGIVVFLVGSALSGAAQSMDQLIIFRGLQGVGGGTVLALVFTIVGDLFPPAERARWQGLFTGVFALASVIGPSAGGWITDNINWRWVFYVNLPLGILALLMIIFWLPLHISQRTTTARGWAGIRRIDFLGAFTAAGATVCLLLGLTWGGATYPWDSPQVITILSASAVLYISFIIIERFVAEPILPLSLFRNQVFAVGAILALLVGLVMFAVVLYLPLYIQGVLRQPATNSGIYTTPLVLTMAIAAALVGLVIARLGRYQVISIMGGLIMVVGAFLMTQITPSINTFDITRDMVIFGLGLGLVQPVLTLAVQNAIPRNRLGVGTGAVTYLRSMGSTLGVAIMGSLVNNFMSSDLATRLPSQAQQLPSKVLGAATNQNVVVSPEARHHLTQAVVQNATAQIPPGPFHNQTVAAIAQQVTDLMGQIFEATRQSLAIGIQNAFYLALIGTVLIVVVTLFLKDVPLAKRVMPATVVANANNQMSAAATLPAPAPVGMAAATQGAIYSNGASATVRPAEANEAASNGDYGLTPSAYALVAAVQKKQQNSIATIQDDWHSRFLNARQDLEDVIAAFYLTHPEYLPSGQRSAVRHTIGLMDLQDLEQVEQAMADVSARAANDHRAEAMTQR